MRDVLRRGVGRPSMASDRYAWMLRLGGFDGLDSARATAWRASD